MTTECILRPFIWRLPLVQIILCVRTVRRPSLLHRTWYCTYNLCSVGTTAPVRTVPRRTAQNSKAAYGQKAINQHDVIICSMPCPQLKENFLIHLPVISFKRWAWSRQVQQPLQQESEFSIHIAFYPSFFLHVFLQQEPLCTEAPNPPPKWASMESANSQDHSVRYERTPIWVLSTSWTIFNG